MIEETALPFKLAITDEMLTPFSGLALFGSSSPDDRAGAGSRRDLPGAREREGAMTPGRMCSRCC